MSLSTITTLANSQSIAWSECSMLASAIDETQNAILSEMLPKLKEAAKKYHERRERVLDAIRAESTLFEKPRTQAGCRHQIRSQKPRPSKSPGLTTRRDHRHQRLSTERTPAPPPHH